MKKQDIRAELKKLKEGFRQLKAKDREKISVALLKVNLGVQSDEEMLRVRSFLEPLTLILKADTLDPLIDFLYSTGSTEDTQEVSRWVAEYTDVSQVERLLPYDEDNVETMKDLIKPIKSS